MHLSRFSLFGLISLIMGPIIHAFDIAVAAVARAAQIAFPPDAATAKVRAAVPEIETVAYSVGKARTQAFLSRIAERFTDRQTFGAVGLCPTA